MGKQTRRLWWHWQNLNESGRYLLYGRVWLHAGDGCVQMSWRVGRWDGLRAMFTRGGCEEDYTLRFGFGWVDLGLTLSGFRPYDALPRGWGRDTGFYLHEDHFVMRWNCDDSSWSSKDGPAHGWGKSWFLKDVLFGPAKYTEGAGEPVVGVVAMPEGDYPVMVRLRVDTWKRPRWPWPLRHQRADVKCPQGIPFPGKGENSWDCGEDALFSSTGLAASVEGAIENVREYVTKRRIRYGGPDWRPARASVLTPED
jgi:hypothetical protein